MTKAQLRALDAFMRISDRDKDNKTVIATIPEFLTESLLIDQIIANIEACIVLGNQPPVVTATTMRTSQGIMGKTLGTFLYSAGVKAEQILSTELATSLKHPITYFTHASKDVSLDRCNKSREVLNKNLDVLTNISEANMTSIDAVIADFVGIKDAIRQQDIERKALVLDPIKLNIKNGKASMVRIIKLLKGSIAKFTPEILSEYELSAKIVKPIAVATPFTITVVDAKTKLPIEVATAVRTSSSAKKKPQFGTNDEGLIVFDTHKAGKVTYTITAAGYEDFTLKFTVKSKVANVVKVAMVASPLPLS